VSFDTVQLQVRVVNQAQLDGAARANASATASKKQVSKGKVLAEKEKVEEYLPDITLQRPPIMFIELPRKSKITTVDFGVNQVFGAARHEFVSQEELESGEPLFTAADTIGGEQLNSGTWMLSTAAFRHATRHRQRRYAMEQRRRRLRKNDKAFAAAEQLWADTNISTADPTKLMAAQAKRASVFMILVRKDGFQRARARFDASIAEEAQLIKEADRLIPTPDHYVCCGDAKFGNLRGSACGVSTRLRRVLDDRHPDNMLPDAPEFRTSKLDSRYHWCARLLPCAPCSHVADAPNSYLRSLMANPVKGVYCGRDGKLHMRHVHGHFIVALPEHKYNVRWNRDINAAINMQIIFWWVLSRHTLLLAGAVSMMWRVLRSVPSCLICRYLYHFGKVPEAFQRSTPKAELDCSIVTRYRYQHMPGMRRFRRSVKAA
jgi:hypothetical protein